MSDMRTFVFTDIVQSVDLKGQMHGRSDAERDEAFVSTILTPHRKHIEEGLPQHGGRVVSTAGDGHFLVFDNTIKAASWAVSVQQRHRDASISTPAGQKVGVRMSLHVGFPQVDPNDPSNFIGRVVDYAARLNDYASSGQVLISAAALGLLKDAGLDGVAFHSHGARQLRGIGPVEVHELLYDGEEARPTRNRPSDIAKRQWTVLPATMGLTEYAQQAGGGSGGVVAPTAPKRRLGNYELGDLLGSGGMGAVYRARHTQFDRDRAVKIIKPSLIPHGQGPHGSQGESAAGEIIKRFYREIKAIGALDHPNIVVAIDSSAPDDETHYLVMEYVDGVGADRLVEQLGALPVAAACAVARQAAVGLEYLHRQGMVHRDIKPSNLMLALVDHSTMPHASPAADSRLGATAPLVKILDLGLALLVTDDQERLTQMGHGAMGTAMYMSPEQWSTTSVDIRSDIYSLGCTLYHLIAGQPPFFDSDLRPQRAHERAPVPTDFGRDVPKQLPKVLERMMAKVPDERFATPADVVAALSELADNDALTEAIQQGRRLQSRQSTVTGLAPGETLPARRQAETLPPHPPSAGQQGWHIPPSKPRPLWRRALAPIAIGVAALAAIWMATIANDRQRSLDELRQQKVAAQLETLVVPAGLAASLLASEIDTRFEILTRLGREPAIRDALAAIDTGDRSTWRAAQQWIVDRKQANDRVAATSWFLVAADGTQVARAKPSSTLGGSYAYRTYFHGGGSDLEEGASAPPIVRTHLSSVYRSDSTKLLKVAFSAPIWRDEPTGNPDDVLGVLGMSVDLGSFRVLEDAERLPESLEVVLIDLRRDDLGPTPEEGAPARRGLLLHHPKLAEYEVPSDPFRLAPPLLAQVDEALKRSTRTGRLSNPIIEGYDDLLGRSGRGPYIGAFEPVVIRNPDEQRDTRLLVIVQREQ